MRLPAGAGRYQLPKSTLIIKLLTNKFYRDLYQQVIPVCHPGRLLQGFSRHIFYKNRGERGEKFAWQVFLLPATLQGNRGENNYITNWKVQHTTTKYAVI